MPFSCLNENNITIFADDFSVSQWEDLKLQAMRGTIKLSLPCCDAKACLRRGKRRRQHFAHYPGECCVSDTWSDYTGRKYTRKGEKSESIDHERIKAIIVDVARKSGWGASSEVEGFTPAGKRWVADVVAAKGELKIAFEIQISPQSFSEYRIRQQRYRESGIKCIWLSCLPPTISDEEIPVFELSRTKDVYVVDFPSFIKPSVLKLAPDVSGLSIGDFIRLMLERQALWCQEWVSRHDVLASLEEWQRTAPVRQNAGGFSDNNYEASPPPSNLSEFSGIKEKRGLLKLAGLKPERDSNQRNNVPTRFGYKMPPDYSPIRHRYMVIFFNANSAPIDNTPWCRSDLPACKAIIDIELPKFPPGSYAEVRETATNEFVE